MLEERNAELDKREKEVEELKKHLFNQESVIQDQQEEVDELGAMLNDHQVALQAMEAKNAELLENVASQNQ